MRGGRLSRFIDGVTNGEPVALIALGVVAVIVIVWIVRTVREAKQK